jgi:Putative Actinobacterial Holin-X, holin superfamily III
MTTHPAEPARTGATDAARPDPEEAPIVGVPHPRATERIAGPIAGSRTPEDAHTDLSSASTAELVRRLSTQLSELVRSELELARTELVAKGRRAGTGAGLAGTGGVVALYGVAALIAAAIAGLATVMPLWLAALGIGVLLLLVAGLFAAVGRDRLRRATPPVPERAVHAVQQDVETIREAVKR